jgi:type IV pilus assembly protein PilY1
MSNAKRLTLTALSAATTLFCSVGSLEVRADDTEVFFSRDSDVTAKPNILFVLDTSQSMYNIEASAPMGSFTPGDGDNPTGPCANDKLYWAGPGDSTPTCGVGSAFVAIDESNFNCPGWLLDIKDEGFGTIDPIKVAQQTSSSPAKFATIQQANLPTYCQGDGTTPSGLDWGAKGKNAITSGSYTFYSGEYLNWLSNAGGGDKYRIDVIREVVAKLVRTTDGINFGLMRYGYDGDRIFSKDNATQCEIEPNPVEGSRSSNGAPIVYPVRDIDSATGISGLPDEAGTSVEDQLQYMLGVDRLTGEVFPWVVNRTIPPDDQPFKVVANDTDDTGLNKCPIPMFTPGGRSPIGGAMYEAYLYYSGQQWSQKYGKNSDLGSGYSFPSVPASRVDGDSGGEIYDSPIADECARNFIILLSDGTTEQDNDVDGPIQQLPGFNRAIGSNKCDADDYLDVNGNPPPSQCVDDAAEYLFETDLSSSVRGVNNVITYTIGFKVSGTDPAADSARQLLTETAERGGGRFCQADTVEQLQSCLVGITREILQSNTTFSAPAVTVNAFNRTQNLNDLYMSLFRPSFQTRWQGNIKKYRLDPVDGDILDANGAPAVNTADGFFQTGAQSYWSSVVDGIDVTKGGAASRLPAWNARNLYTTDSDGNRVLLSALSLTDTDLGIDTGSNFIDPADSTSGLLTASALVEWFLGRDVADADTDGNTTETRKDMGDPLHGKPVTVIYGGEDNPSTPALEFDVNDATLYAVTNDGVLHAIDPSTGDEKWSFVPSNLLGRLKDLYYDETLDYPETERAGAGGYGLDGNIRVVRIDNNRNGIIEPTQWVDLDKDGEVDTDEDIEYDRVYLFVGQRRGGNNYYAFDVSRSPNKTTSPGRPRLMWVRNYASDLAGESWSTPTPAKVRIDTGTEVQTRNVLFFGGGYDSNEDLPAYPATASTRGAGVYMVDMLTGNLLWRAGSDDAATLELADMTSPIPGDIRVIDLTGDGFADRLYAADLGGRVWRFDIFNGEAIVKTPTSGPALIEGGVLAALGSPEDPSDVDNAIRFFYAPDPALINASGVNFINVAIGSGHRELPASDLSTENWFFSVRDYNVFRQLLRSQYQDSCVSVTGPCHEIVTEDDLIDLTNTVGQDATNAVPVGPVGSAVPGWKIELQLDGEKVLAESRTFQNDVYFTTYAPVERGSTEDTCGVIFGQNRLYVVNAVDARPANLLFDQVTGESVEDRGKDLAQGSIAPEVVFVFPTPPTDANNPNPAAPPPVCLVGLENCGFGLGNRPVRTYWRQRGAN